MGTGDSKWERLETVTQADSWALQRSVRVSWLPPLLYLASLLPHFSSWDYFSDKSPPIESLVHDL